MNKLWIMETSFSVFTKFGTPNADGASPIHISYYFHQDDQTKNFQTGIYTGHWGPRPSPSAELILEIEDFGFDYFKWSGSIFVSERMRQIMALKPPEVLFHEIDASDSAALPRSKNYQIMEPVTEEDVSDPENSIYEMHQLMPGMDPLPINMRRLAIRPDALPKHELFYDRFFCTELMCTDAFASRVLEAGCTGIQFRDPNTLVGENRLCRTLRGIEKIVALDPITFGEITELVEPIARRDT